MRCFRSPENAKRVLFFLLARIDRTEETKQALHKRDTNTRHPFLCMVLQIYNTTINYKMKKWCVVSKARKMQSACFFFFSLASIEQKKQSKHCMKEIQTHGTHFCAWYYGFCFCSYVLPGEKEFDCFTHKASKGRFLLLLYLYGLTFYLQLACGPQRLCKTE